MDSFFKKMRLNKMAKEDQTPQHQSISPTLATVLTLLIELHIFNPNQSSKSLAILKIHKNKNYFGSDIEFCTVSLLVMLKH
jgi:hypothetical protein